MTITDYNKCCGCAACADICPKGCISMTYNKHGFLYPEIDNKQCVNCSRCVSVCPQNNTVKQSGIKKIFKGYASDIDSDDNQKSTSGAIFPLLAKSVIENGGIVVGAAFDRGFNNVSHIVCENMAQVNLCRGSKYIQSKTQGIYKQIDVFLKMGKTVLFSGTPCQIAALKAYLKTVPDNLLTVDFICHGVGSTKFYQEYIKSVTADTDVSHIGFRDKCGDYLKSQFRIINSENRTLVAYRCYDNGFGKAFANNLISRKSCGTCSYSTVQRVSDISLADNILFNTETEKKHGSSFVFINTQKGFDLLEAVKDSAVFEELDKETVIPKIMHLNHPPIPHQSREKLLNALATKGYKKASEYISDYRPKTSVTKRAFGKLKQIVRRIIR